jgi:hypothetical protein
MNDDRLKQAVSLYKQGNKSQAAILLGEIVRQTPNDINAWYGLALSLDEPDKKIFCLKKVVDLEPSHEKARQLLEKLQAEQLPFPAIQAKVENNYQPSTQKSESISTESIQTVQPKRGGCLTAFLILMFITNPLVAIYYFVTGSSVRQALPNMPAWIIPALGIIGIANFIFAIAVWKWKKWGMYGLATTAGITFFINAIGINILTAIWGLVGVALLAFLLRQVWSQME